MVRTKYIHPVTAVTLLLIFYGFIICQPTFASCNTHTIKSKALQKELRLRIKQLTKEAWQTWDSTFSLVDALTIHYQRLEQASEKVTLYEGQAVAKDINTAITRATQQAKTKFVNIKEAEINGEIRTNITNKSTSESVTVIQYSSVFQSTAEHRISFKKPSLCLIRSTSDGQYEAYLIFIIDDEI